MIEPGLIRVKNIFGLIFEYDVIYRLGLLSHVIIYFIFIEYTVGSLKITTALSRVVFDISFLHFDIYSNTKIMNIHSLPDSH
jgi:hypothetical protein